jgi:hypothetical protein
MDVAERNKCSRAFRKTCLLLFMVPGTGFRSSTANLLIFLSFARPQLRPWLAYTSSDHQYVRIVVSARTLKSAADFSQAVLEPAM